MIFQLFLISFSTKFQKIIFFFNNLTPLIIAIEKENVEIVDYLLSFQNIDISQNVIQTVFQIQNKEIIQLFMNSKSINVYPKTPKRSGTKEVTVPPFIKKIKRRAFYKFNNLTNISLPSTLIAIKDDAFNGCSMLTTIVIPSSVTFIGNYVFSECTSLTRIELSSSLISIGEGCFYKCQSLRKIVIPSSIEKIGKCAFKECKLLSEVIISSSLIKSIEDNTFYQCESLEKISIPASVTSIGWCSFYGCKKLSKSIIPPTVTTIDDNAFDISPSLFNINVNNCIQPNTNNNLKTRFSNFLNSISLFK